MLNKRNILFSLVGSTILAFGIYHVHSISGVTEGGTLGLTLLLEHWFGLSPAWTSLILNGACYWLGIRTLGRHFLLCSLVSAGGFSAAYTLLERFPRLWPQLCNMPFLAAILGALFVGLGIGLCVRAGGAPTGDDALAMSLSTRLRLPIEQIYLVSDMTVLALSLSYLSPACIAWSVLTVVLSGRIIGIVQRYPQKQPV